MPTRADSVHLIAAEFRQHDAPTQAKGSAQSVSANVRGRRILTAFSVFGWASIGILFAHAVLMSVDASLCLLGCEPAVTASGSPSSTTRHAEGSSDPSPYGQRNGLLTGDGIEPTADELAR